MTDLIDILYYEATGKLLTKEERIKIDEMLEKDNKNDKRHTKEIRKAKESSSS